MHEARGLATQRDVAAVNAKYARVAAGSAAHSEHRDARDEPKLHEARGDFRPHLELVQDATDSGREIRECDLHTAKKAKGCSSLHEGTVKTLS